MTLIARPKPRGTKIRLNKVLAMLTVLCLTVPPGGASADPARTKSRVLFAGRDATGNINLWVTDGTNAGTTELTAAGGGGTSPLILPRSAAGRCSRVTTPTTTTRFG